MKLFKKLATAALAAVLALAMVGCGAKSTADELADIVMDIMKMEAGADVDMQRTNAMDQLAAKLAANIDKAEAGEGATVAKRLKDNKVLAAAGFKAEDLEDVTYLVSAVENYQFKSAITTSKEKAEWMVRNLLQSPGWFGHSESAQPTKAELGVTTAKIDGTEYLIVLIKMS
mgnify:CR=1 FL=1